MLFVFIMICIIIGIAGGVVYLFYNFFRYRLIQSGKLSLRLDSQINKFYIISLILIAVISTYLAYFPTDDFYFNEFKSVTLRKVPSSAEIIKKKASYPDVHGKYCSSCLVQLSKADYIKLYNEINQDPRFKKNGEILNAEEFDHVLSSDKRDHINHFIQRVDSNRYGPYSYIGFLNDSGTIIINKHSD